MPRRTNVVFATRAPGTRGATVVRYGKRRRYRKNRAPGIPRSRKSFFPETRIVQFKRTKPIEVVLKSANNNGWTWNSNADYPTLATHFVFDAQNSVDGMTELASLFDQYKLVGVRLCAYYSNVTNVDNANNQIVMYTIANRTGQDSVTELTEDYFLSRPRHKKKVLLTGSNKPAFDMYFPLNQLTMKYASATNTDYSISKPNFISTNELTTQHYGVSALLKRIDSRPFSAGQKDPDGVQTTDPILKIYQTIYLKCRGVK